METSQKSHEKLKIHNSMKTSTSTRFFPILSLPDDILVHIFFFVGDVKTLFISIPCVCKHFKRVLDCRWHILLTQIPEPSLKWFKALYDQGFDVLKAYRLFKPDYSFSERKTGTLLDQYFVACYLKSLKAPVQYILETSTDYLAFDEEMKATIRVLNVGSETTEVYIGEIGKGETRPSHHCFESGTCFFMMVEGCNNHRWIEGKDKKGIGSKIRLKDSHSP
jgi:hypothetical protein